MVGAAADVAGMIAKLNPVPLEQWHRPWSDRRQPVAADAPRAVKIGFRFCNVLCAAEM